MERWRKLKAFRLWHAPAAPSDRCHLAIDLIRVKRFETMHG